LIAANAQLLTCGERAISHPERSSFISSGSGGSEHNAAGNRRWKLDRAAIAWLSSKPGRKPISVSADAAVLRQFYRYLHRSSEPGTVAEPIWPHLPTESSFLPYSLSEKDVLHLLALCANLKRPPRLPVETASGTFRSLFKLAGLKPERGRIGPRPYDLRHAFAVHRLSRWYGEGADLHARLPWLSAYMGHVDIIGTESYVHTRRSSWTWPATGCAADTKDGMRGRPCMSRSKSESLLGLTESFFHSYLQRTRGGQRAYRASLPRRAESSSTCSWQIRSVSR